MNVLARIGDETRESLEKLFPEGLGGEPEVPDAQRPVGSPSLAVLHDGSSGVTVAVAAERIWELACAAEVTVALVPMLGDFVPHRSVLFEVWGDASRLDIDALADTVAIGRERTFMQDPGFGFRGIVDIAERALSPGINDPTTAVQAIDQLHDLLRRLCTRRFPDPVRVDEQGISRVVLPRPDFDAYVRLALDEIRAYGHSSVQVVRRLRFLLEDLLSIAPPGRCGELQLQLRALDAAALSESSPAALALGRTLSRPSRQGHGP